MKNEKIESFAIYLGKVGLNGCHLSAKNIEISKGDDVIPSHFVGYSENHTTFSFDLTSYDLEFDFLTHGIAFFNLVRRDN